MLLANQKSEIFDWYKFRLIIYKRKQEYIFVLDICCRCQYVVNRAWSRWPACLSCNIRLKMKLMTFLYLHEKKLQAMSIIQSLKSATVTINSTSDNFGKRNILNCFFHYHLNRKHLTSKNVRCSQKQKVDFGIFTDDPKS